MKNTKAIKPENFKVNSSKENKLKDKLKKLIIGKFDSVTNLARIIEIKPSHLLDMLNGRQHMNLHYYIKILEALGMPYVSLDEDKMPFTGKDVMLIPVVKYSPNICDIIKLEKLPESSIISHRYFESGFLKDPIAHKVPTPHGYQNFDPSTILLIERHITESDLKSKTPKLFLTKKGKNSISFTTVSLAKIERKESKELDEVKNTNYILSFGDRPPLILDNYDKISNVVLGRVIRAIKDF